MIDYGAKITITGDAAEKLKRIADISKDVEASAAKAGTTVKREFQQVIKTQREVITGLEADYKRLKAAAEEAAPGMAKLSAMQAATSAKKELDSEREALVLLNEARDQATNKTISQNSAIYGLGASMRGLVALYTAGVGVVGSFTTENEKLQRIQGRLSQGLAVLVGLEGASEAYKRMQAKGVGILVTVTNAWRLAQTKLTAALWGSNVAAKALMGTVTLGLSVAIGFAISAIDKYQEKQRKAREELELARKKQKEYNDSVAQTAAESIMSYKKMQSQWEKLGDSMDKKQEFIKKNKSAFEELGVSINKVSDAEKFFTRGEGDFVQSMIKRAKAIAAINKAAELSTQALTLMLESEDAREQIKNIKQQGESIDKSKVDPAILKTKIQDAGALLNETETTTMMGSVAAVHKYTGETRKYLQNLKNQYDQWLIIAANNRMVNEANKKSQRLFELNNDLAESGNVSKSSYTSADATSSLSGRSRGGSQSKAITINITAPIVQIDSTHIDNKQYTAQQIGEIAAKELVNIMSQVAVQ